MQKIVHLRKRKAGIDVGDFQQRLLAIRQGEAAPPDVLHYVQSHTLLRGYRKGELLFDALEELSFHTAEQRAAFLSSAAHRLMCDRRNDLVDATESTTLLVDVHRIKDGSVPADSVKNIEFVTRRPTVALPEFRRYWRDIHGPIGANIPSILRYEQNHTSTEAYTAASAPRFDGLAITWFASTAAMREGALSPEYAVTRADEPNFLPDGHLPIIITREVFISSSA